MKVAVTGANGFLGKSFCEYARELSSLQILEFVRAPGVGQFSFDLSDPSKAKDSLLGVDTVVHCAFDHSYRFNRSGLVSLIDICKVNNVSKLIFLSSISVYDQEVIGELDETSPYSRLNDPYSNEKQYLENLLSSVIGIDIVILQPTVVYGRCSVWDRFAQNALAHSVVCLPLNGEGLCNLTFIEDLNKAILCCVTVDFPNVTKFIVSSKVISWKQFYLSIADRYGVDNVRFADCFNKYHNNFVLNFLFVVWYETRLGLLINLFTPLLKRLRALFLGFKTRRFTISEGSALKFPIQSPFTPLGITRLYHSVSYIADTSKLQRTCIFGEQEVRDE